MRDFNYRDLFVPTRDTGPQVICFLVCFLFGMTQLSWILAAFSDHYSPQVGSCAVNILDTFGLIVHCFTSAFCFGLVWVLGSNIRSVLRRG